MVETFEIKIVRATPRDARPLAVMTNEYFDYAQLDREKIIERLESGEYEYWLARDAASGALAGFIDVDFTPVPGLRKEGDAAVLAVAGVASPKQAKILGLAVLPEFRGRGIARQLVAKAAERAKARECAKIFLLVREDNEGARGLYEKLDFALAGALAEKLWDQRILLYAKLI
ncbi:MAG: GNAT family N-acetyltransferase [Candidatus Micrarchaeota archaeon]